jgi:predicted nuclease of predicted toxin-antitoxin system
VKFLLDMGLARHTAAYLRAEGHDAIHLRDQGLQRLEDPDIIRKAQAEGRVILTHDLDFSRLIALSRARLPSIITFRLADMRPTAVNHWLQDILVRFQVQLEEGTLISVTDRGVRLRPLPIGERAGNTIETD